MIESSGQKIVDKITLFLNFITSIHPYWDSLNDLSRENSNNENNPEHFIFCLYSGKRKGLPYDPKNVSINLNKFARIYNIVDENGDIWHF